MSDLDAFDELEQRLARVFHDGLLPVAPERLRTALEDAVTHVASETPRSARRGPWLVLGLAAVLAVGGALMVSSGGIGPGPTAPNAETTRIEYQIAWTPTVPASVAIRGQLVSILRSRLATLGRSTATVTSGSLAAVTVEMPTDAKVAAVRQALETVGHVAFVPLGRSGGAKGDPLDPGLPALLTNDDIASASVAADQTGSRVIDVQLTPSGTSTFATWTRTHVGEVLAMAVDGTIIAAPRIMNEIPGGNLEINAAGGWDADEASRIVAIATSGPLPVAIGEVTLQR